MKIRPATLSKTDYKICKPIFLLVELLVGESDPIPTSAICSSFCVKDDSSILYAIIPSSTSAIGSLNVFSPAFKSLTFCRRRKNVALEQLMTTEKIDVSHTYLITDWHFLH